MRRNVLLFLGLASLITVLGACGPEPRAYDDESCGQFFPAEGAMPALCDDACVDLATNRDNCGYCGNNCQGDGVNACDGGRCVCANADRTVVSKDACDFPAVCDETGWCLAPDPRGAQCDEIDGIYCDDPSRVCVQGYCTVPDCAGPETCNLLDDDCDGLADQTDVGQPLSQSCYSGDPATIGVGICRAGEELCVAGQWTPCGGENLPQTEEGLLACDGLDNDCNACIDDQFVDMDGDGVDDDGVADCGPVDPKSTDIVFMIDISGSMGGVLSAVITATGDFATTYQSASHIRWGIERIAEPQPTYVEVWHPLSTFMPFLARLGMLTISGGTEPTYDAVYVTATGGYDAQLFGATTPGEVQVYVVFGDEDAQTLTGQTEATVCAAVAARGAILVVFTNPIYYSQWDACAVLYPLTSDANQMTTQLDDLFDLTCTF